MENREGDGRCLDQAFLRQLRTEIAAFLETVGPHDRPCDVMVYSGCLRCGKQVGGGSDEEVQRCSLLKRGRVRDVDNDLRALQDVSETLTSKSVHTRFRGCRNSFVTALVELRNEFGTDEAGAPNHNDLCHVTLLSCGGMARLWWYGALVVVWRGESRTKSAGGKGRHDPPHNESERALSYLLAPEERVCRISALLLSNPHYLPSDCRLRLLRTARTSAGRR